MGNPGSAAYSAAKHGVVGLTRSASAEHGRHGVRVNAVAPGLTRTAMVRHLAEREHLDVDAVVADNRWAGSANRTRSPRPSCGCPPRAPGSSPDTS